LRVRLFNRVRVYECYLYTGVYPLQQRTNPCGAVARTQKMQAQERENRGNAFPWARMCVASGRLALAFTNYWSMTCTHAQKTVDARPRSVESV
jgi:hypothetical protein